MLNNFFIELSSVYRFTLRVIVSLFSSPFEFTETKRQVFMLGYRTLLIISFTAFIVGLVFTRQSRAPLVTLGAEAYVPSLVSVAIIRSLGPLVVALIASGKMGSSIGAELSAMNVSEQIDAMNVSGTNPFSYLVVTRVVAAGLVLPMLVMYANALALIGSFIIVNVYSGISFRLFLMQALDALSYSDLFTSLIKPVFFGLAIGMVSTYFGYYSERATTGVGKAATSSVVVSMVFIFIIDFMVLHIVSLITP